MSSFSRKISRKRNLKVAKTLKKEMGKILKDSISRQASRALKVPDYCSVCDKKFDKTDREQVFSWMLQVRTEEQENYDLFCPSCYSSYIEDPSSGSIQEEVNDEQ